MNAPKLSLEAWERLGHRSIVSPQIAISLDNELLRKLDGLVEKQVFPSVDMAIQSAVREKLARLENERFAEEPGKLDPNLEQAMGEEETSNLTSLEALDALQKRLQVDAKKAAKWLEAVHKGRR